MGKSRAWQFVLIALVSFAFGSWICGDRPLAAAGEKLGDKPTARSIVFTDDRGVITGELAVRAGTGKEPPVLVLLDNLGKEVWSGSPNARVMLAH
jgi:hypothetical protein